MTPVWKSRYRVSGRGPALLLIHGVGLAMTMWDSAAALLEPHYTVIRYDLIGHGRTPAGGATVSLSDFVGQVQDLLDHLAVERPSVLGFSLGGIVARGWAAAFPKRVDKLVVLCSIAPRSAPERQAIAARLQLLEQGGVAATVDAAIGRWFTPAFIQRRPEVVEQVRQTLLSNAGHGYPAAYRFFATADSVIDGIGRRISCPTLAITAEDDVGSTPEMARRIAGETRRGEVHVVPGLRHMAVVESPAAVLRPVLDFLALRA